MARIALQRLALNKVALGTAQTPVRPRRSVASIDPIARSPLDTWDGAVSDYLDDCRRRNHTPATLAVYTSALLGNPCARGGAADVKARRPAATPADRPVPSPRRYLILMLRWALLQSKPQSNALAAPLPAWKAPATNTGARCLLSLQVGVKNVSLEAVLSATWTSAKP
jgi:hypothetical protein